MATKFNPDVAIARCFEVKTSLEQATQADRRKSLTAQTFNKLADKIMLAQEDGTRPTYDVMFAAYDAYDGSGDTEQLTAPDELAEELYAYAAALNPMAGTKWSRDEISDLVDKLKAMQTLNETEGFEGILTDEQSEQVTEIMDALSGLRKGVGGGGSRAPRTEAAPVEGRPYERVIVRTIDGGKEFANQSADKTNSSSNVKNAVVKALSTAGVSLSDSDKAQILTDVKSVVEGGEPNATIHSVIVVEGVKA
jgi:hypothetical protein